jgi:hypothetical protein
VAKRPGEEDVKKLQAWGPLITFMWVNWKAFDYVYCNLWVCKRKPVWCILFVTVEVMFKFRAIQPCRGVNWSQGNKWCQVLRMAVKWNGVTDTVFILFHFRKHGRRQWGASQRSVPSWIFEK